MITIEEKLNVFSKLVCEGERHKANEQIEKKQKHNDEIIKKHYENSIKKAEEIEQKRNFKANNKKKEIIARASMEVKKKIFRKKSELLNRLEKEVEDKAIEFVKTNEYELFLLNKLSKILLTIKEKENNSIYLTKKDLDRYEDKIIEKLDSLGNQKNKVILGKLDDNKIGGLVLINHDKNVRIDLSIKTILEESKDLIGKILYSSLEEVGD